MISRTLKCILRASNLAIRTRVSETDTGAIAACAAVGLLFTFVSIAELSGQTPSVPRPTRLPSVAPETNSSNAVDATNLKSTPNVFDTKPSDEAAFSKPTRLPSPDPKSPVRELRTDSAGGLVIVVPPPTSTPSPSPVWGTNLEAASETPFDLFGFDAKIESPYHDFSPTPLPQSSMTFDGDREQWVYDAKHDVPTQHPWIEWGRIFYGDGITPRGRNWFGETNLARPKFYLYGDFRTGVISGRNAAGRTDNWANRLNLDMDLQLTDSGRFHSFVGPIDKNGAFTRVERVAGDLRYREEIDFTPVTAFFEGDIGTMIGGATGQTSPFELPITVGLVPLLFQNGIWMEDAVTGAAFSLPARHSRLLNWSNYDATFFAVFDQLNSPAFGSDEHAAQAFGTAWFIEAYGGYIETGYAYVRDRNQQELSYHNMTASFTRRYFDRISNSIRLIVNTGQDLAPDDRTADGALLLFENSWITSSPLTVVPYANFFCGWDRPQSVARAGVSGGILRNTGINFDTDGLNGFATLDPTASDTAGASVGVDLIGDDLNRQLLLEVSYLTPHGDKNAAVPDDQFATGTRYQFPISNWSLLRFDMMYGWRQGLEDVYGTRMEYRWKF